ncbi:hypothetical protein [Dysgonomonas termitidis]|uniref:Uncharacterized protein n=1 Tax=Dysgonomonas termitidis TaxID=1516126 RepID=A0ABV9KQU0_9BACT
MGKKINIQRDLESRRGISENNAMPKFYVEPEKQEKDAESEIIQEKETDQEVGQEAVPKRRRPSKGNA